jgi:hypothetical protein
VIVLDVIGIKTAEAELLKNGLSKKSISELSIVDHGVSAYGLENSAEQMIGLNKLTMQDMASLSNYLTANAMVVFYGCYVGSNTEYLNAASNAFGGRAVYAPRGAMHYPSRITRKYGIYVKDYSPLPSPIKNEEFNRSQ